MKQLTFFSMPKHIGKLFIPTKGRRKSRRPLSTRHPIHLVMHADSSELRKREREFQRHWHRFARQFGVNTYRLVMNSNHVHAVIRLHELKSYSRFIQALTGTLARKFALRWRERPVTRLVNWGKDFKRLCQYVKLNFLEANSFLAYQSQRTRRLPDWVKL